tara:strand:+ start:4587 stop:5990 length:1404 start_codon:yes stop_codon:yes gene_type:complete
MEKIIQLKPKLYIEHLRLPKQSFRFGLLIICSLYLMIFLSGCQSSYFIGQSSKKAALDIRDLSNEKYAEEASSEVHEKRLKSNDLWVRLRSKYKLRNINHPKISVEINRLKNNPQTLDIILKRSERYLFYIINQVEVEGLPGELALLPAIESSFRPYAYSPLGASGLWQFMPATGKGMGLRQNWWYDGRRDVTAATNAALKFLKILNKRFKGDWLHTLAAYNAGGGKVSRAIRKEKNLGKSISFWNLDLPRETDRYVPRLLALAKIIDDPNKYGISLPSLKNKPYFVQIETKSQIDLKIAAKLAKISIDELLLLNPGFNRWATAPNGPHHLLLPIENRSAFEIALKTLPDENRIRWKNHSIKNGETLSQIALRYSISVNAIKKANKLNSDLIRSGRKLFIPLSDMQRGDFSVRKLPGNRSKMQYKVKRGDSLYKIAKKFKVRVSDLRRWNVVGRYIKPGQRILIYTR